jgi:hypothetical protein
MQLIVNIKEKSPPWHWRDIFYSAQRPDRLCGHPASYPMDTEGSYTGGMVAGVWG